MFLKKPYLYIIIVFALICIYGFIKVNTLNQNIVKTETWYKIEGENKEKVRIKEVQYFRNGKINELRLWNIERNILTMSYYDTSNIKTMEEVYYDTSLNYGIKESYKYDSFGNVIGIERCNIELKECIENVTLKFVNELNEDNKAIYTEIVLDGNIISYNKRYFDSSGYIIEETSLDTLRNKLAEEYFQYDNEGNIVRNTLIFKEKNINREITYSYQDKRIMEESISFNGKLEDVKKFIYKNGKLVQIDTKDIAHEKSSKIIIEYIYW